MKPSQGGRGAALYGSQLSCPSVALVLSSPQEVSVGASLESHALAPGRRGSTWAGSRSILFLAIPKDTTWIFYPDM